MDKIYLYWIKKIFTEIIPIVEIIWAVVNYTYFCSLLYILNCSEFSSSILIVSMLLQLIHWWQEFKLTKNSLQKWLNTEQNIEHVCTVSFVFRNDRTGSEIATVVFTESFTISLFLYSKLLRVTCLYILLYSY